MPVTTIKDVAQLAGVSIATVSYVINNGPRPVHRETRARVLQAMEQLGYEPNVSARRLRLNQTHVIGLAIAGLSGRTGIADLYFLDTMLGISAAVDHLEYDLMLFSHHDRLQSEDFFRSLARRRMVDGLIASGGAVNPRGLTLLVEAGLPVVAVGRQQVAEGVCRIDYSFADDAYRSTRALVRRGHRRIGLILNKPVFQSEPLRLEGYRRALAEAGIEYDAQLVFIPPEVVSSPPRQAVDQLVSQCGATGLITTGFTGVCAYLQQIGKAGEGVEVVTLDLHNRAPLPPNLVMGIRQPKFEAGQRAVELLLDLIQGKAQPQVLLLPSTVEFGEL